jgi:hypothetical protein
MRQLRTAEQLANGTAANSTTEHDDADGAIAE